VSQSVSQELFDRSSADENFLKNVITSDETLVYDYDVETKVQSSQWSPRPKKSTSGSLKCEGDIESFFYWKRIVYYEFVPRGKAVNKEFYLNDLKRLREAVRRMRPEAWTNTWMQCHDNAPAHVSLLICEFLTKHETTLVPQPPYFPDLTPVDFFLFPKLKSSLKGHRFQTVVETEENLTWNLRAIPQNTFQNAFQNWKKRL